MTTSSAIARLTAAFDATAAHGGPIVAAIKTIDAGPDNAAPAAVLSWPSVPVEIIRAAALRPVFVRGGDRPTVAADSHLEPGVFPNRLHQLVDAAVTGQLADAACVILPRGSDPDYKCFLYLRELVRRGVVSSLPPILLFDLLQSNGPDVRAYNAGRARELFATLAAIASVRPSLDALRQQIAATNAARAARRRLRALRDDVSRLPGTEALRLLGAFWQMAPGDYAALAAEARTAIASRPALGGPRVLLAGAPVDGSALHAAVESHGAVVVAETSPWGSGAAHHDVDETSDPIAAVADTYRTDAVGPRLPLDLLRRRIGAMLNVDAVVVSLPADDSVFGWDYPWLRDDLACRRISHVVLDGDPRGVTGLTHSSIAALLAAPAQREARHA